MQSDMMGDDQAPKALSDLRDFMHVCLMPLAVQAGAVRPGESIADLAAAYGRAERSEAHGLMCMVAFTSACAFADWCDSREGTGWAEMTGAASSIAQFCHGFLTSQSGAMSATKAALATLGAQARHAPTRDAKQLTLRWWANHGSGGRMTKERAADAIVALRLVNEKRSTIRAWLRGA